MLSGPRLKFAARKRLSCKRPNDGFPLTVSEAADGLAFRDGESGKKLLDSRSAPTLLRHQELKHSHVFRALLTVHQNICNSDPTRCDVSL